MMSTRRSLFGLGKLVVAAAAALLVLGPSIAHAQTAAPNAIADGAVTVTPVEHDKLLVQWTYHGRHHQHPRAL